MSRASPATCTCKAASKPTRWCRIWPQSFGAWPTGLAEQSRSLRMRPRIPFTSSRLPMSSVASSPIKDRPPRLGTPWPWSAGWIRMISTARRWNTSRTWQGLPATAWSRPMWWPWDARHVARPTGWASGCCIPSNPNRKSSLSAQGWKALLFVPAMSSRLQTAAGVAYAWVDASLRQPR